MIDMLSLMKLMEGAVQTQSTDNSKRWMMYEDEDHNPDYNPNGVEVWRLDPRGLGEDEARRLFREHMKKLDPDGSRLRGFTPGIDGSWMFHLKKLLPPTS